MLTLVFYSAELLDIMIKSVPESYCRFGKRLSSFVDANAATKEPIHLSFDDGTTAVCDVLIGADGVKSAVRTSLFEENAEAFAPSKFHFVLLRRNFTHD